MNFNELPQWAKDQVQQMVFDSYKSTHPRMEEKEIQSLVNEYISLQTFGILYNDKGECLYQVRWW